MPNFFSFFSFPYFTYLRFMYWLVMAYTINRLEKIAKSGLEGSNVHVKKVPHLTGACIDSKQANDSIQPQSEQ